MRSRLVLPSSGSVIQRDSTGIGWIDVSSCGPSARVRATRRGEIIESTDAGGTACLPTGGPYAVETRQHTGAYEIVVENLFVGDLWVLAGQSNMVGCGRLSDARPEPYPAVRVCRSDERWAVAAEPLVERVDDPVGYLEHIDPKGSDFSARQRADVVAMWRPRGLSPAVAFGRAVYEASGVPIGLLPTAVGGSLLEAWQPPSSPGDPGGPHYVAMLELVAAARGAVAGVLWYQGESDANQRAGMGYEKATAELISAFRRDLLTAGSRLAVYVVQQCRMATEVTPDTDRAWSVVREAQRQVKQLGGDGMVSAVDLQLDDIVHVNGEDVVRLGRRLARLATGSPTLNLSRVEVASTGIHIDVSYEGVTGRLSPRRNIAGFAVRDKLDNELPIIHWTGVDDARGDVVRLVLGRPPRPGDTLWYGYGANPVCNLVDGADMSAPAFGPVELI